MINNIPDDVPCISCKQYIQPCLLASKTGDWMFSPGDEDKPRPKICIWRNLCCSCGLKSDIKRSVLSQVKMKLPVFVDLIELPLPYGLRYKRRKKKWKSKAMKAQEAEQDGVQVKEKKNALDIISKSSLPSPKSLKYLCMQRMVNGAFLYINSGRKWEMELIIAERKVKMALNDYSKVNRQLEKYKSKLDHCISLQDELTKHVKMYSASSKICEKDIDELLDILQRTSDKHNVVTHSLHSIQTRARKDDRPTTKSKVKQLVEKQCNLQQQIEILNMRISELHTWDEHLYEQSETTVKDLKLQRALQSNYEDEYNQQKEITDKMKNKYNRILKDLEEPRKKLKRCLDARYLFKGHLDEYMEQQFVEHMTIRGKLTSKESMAFVNDNAMKSGLEVNFSRKPIKAPEIRILSYFWHGHQIQHLKLGFNRLKSDDIKDLLEELKVNSFLKHLDLSFNELRENGTRDICDTLATGMGGLQSLNLRGNHLGLEGTRAIALLLEDSQCNLTQLNLFQNNIEIEGSIVLSEALKLNKTLKSLNLRYNGIYPAGAAALADMLKVNESLTELNLTDNHIGPDGAADLSRHMKGSLGAVLNSVGYGLQNKNQNHNDNNK